MLDRLQRFPMSFDEPEQPSGASRPARPERREDRPPQETRPERTAARAHGMRVPFLLRLVGSYGFLLALLIISSAGSQLALPRSWQLAIAIVGAASAVIFVAAAWSATIRPLRKARDSLRNMALLDLRDPGDTTPTVLGVRFDDEFRQMGEDLRASLRNTADVLSEIRTAAAHVSGASRSLVERAGAMRLHTGTTARAGQNGGSAAGGTGASAANTSESISSIAAAVEELSVTFTQLSGGAVQMKDSFREVSARCSSGALASRTAKDEVDAVSRTVDELQAASGKIGAVVELIASVADQTKLLALNATIEAARAGSAGVGFAVVADEVKGLAKQTGLATDEIRELISAIQRETLRAVEGVARMSGIVEQVREMSQAIAAATEEQTAVMTHIAQSIADMSHVTTELSRDVSTVSLRASEVSDALALAVEDISDQAHLLETSATGLEQVIGRFRA